MSKIAPEKRYYVRRTDKGGEQMKKVVFTALFLFLIAIPVSAQAAQRSTASIPNIAFSGTTATCTVSVNGDSANDSISLTVKLYQGNECIATWTDSGNGKLRFSRTKSVQSGKTYKLTADVTINGTALGTTSATGTCP